MMTECLVNAGMFRQAAEFAEEVKDAENNSERRHKAEWSAKLFENLTESTEYRRQVIRNYTFMPEYIGHCGYFGCKLHHTVDIGM